MADGAVFTSSDARMVLDTCRAIRQLGILSNYRSQPSSRAGGPRYIRIVNKSDVNIGWNEVVQVQGAEVIGGAYYMQVTYPVDPIGFHGPYLITSSNVVGQTQFDREYLRPGFRGSAQVGPLLSAKYGGAFDPLQANREPGMGMAPSPSGSLFISSYATFTYIAEPTNPRGTEGATHSVELFVMVNDHGRGRFVAELTEPTSVQGAFRKARCKIFDPNGLQQIYTDNGSAGLEADVFDSQNVFDVLDVGDRVYVDQVNRFFFATQAVCPL